MKFFSKLAIQTYKGVKVADVAWGTEKYFQLHCENICATSAPELCIEILSRSNTMLEMQEKISLYLEVGAIEVWLIDQQGLIRFFNAEGEQQQSCFTTAITTLN